MFRKLLLPVSIVSILAFTSCENGSGNEIEKGKEVSSSDATASDTIPAPSNIIVFKQNPNGVSELAQLMKDCYEDLMNCRESVSKEQMEFPEELIARIEKFTTATPTEDHMKTPAFGGYAGLLLDRSKKLQAASEGEQKEAFNVLIQSCLSCHSQTCPGPMPRIEKLMLK